jgi:SAM-dependent methyltransferase
MDAFMAMNRELWDEWTADFSPRAVALAARLSQELSLDARFVESDLYELPDRLEGRFDIVYTSRGALGWLPDIRRWAQVVAHFVKPGGIFFLCPAGAPADLIQGLPSPSRHCGTSTSSVSNPSRSRAIAS